MRKIFDCPQGTPLEAFFIETSTLPIRIILMGRRLMYFWTVLNKPETELVRQVLEAQKIFKTDGCWVETAEDDLKACEIYLTEDAIKNLSKFRMTKLVNEKIQSLADKYLLEMQESHVKTKNILTSAKMKEYLCCEELTTEEKRLLFKLRISMVQLKANFKNSYRENLHCEMCNDYNSEESQMHHLECQFPTSHPDLKVEIKTVKYEDIFKDLPIQIKAVKAWRKIMKIRKIRLGLK